MVHRIGFTSFAALLLTASLSSACGGNVDPAAGTVGNGDGGGDAGLLDARADGEGGADGGTSTPRNDLADHPLAAFCDGHLADCESVYPKCERVSSPLFDREVEGGARCWSDSPYALGGTAVVQCVPRSVEPGSVEPTAGYDRLIDPRTGHCVSIALHEYSPSWSPCEELMRPCGGAPVPGCAHGDSTDATCYTACNSRSDCKDPATPYCSRKGLFMGGDSSCNGQIQVCRAQAFDDCP